MSTYVAASRMLGACVEVLFAVVVARMEEVDAVVFD